jgi:hypothetical protein
MKIDENGELLADWEAIRELSICYDNGCKSEEAYRAKLFTLVSLHGYDCAIDEMEEQSRHTMLLLSCTGGNA